jgi:hypothetical protein
MTIVDLRHLRRIDPESKKVKLERHGRDWVPVRFAPGAVRGVVLHQTAVQFGFPKGRKGDYDALHERACNVACHAMAFQDGAAVLATPLDWVVNHGNGFNDYSYGLEVDGLFPGLLARRTAKHSPLSLSVVEGAREALRFLVFLGRAAGHPMTHIWGHRQSSGSRRADPGPELWKAVVLDYAVPVLGLKTEPALWLPASHRRATKGRPIPVEWDREHGCGKY